jgi:hypothetical protein
LNTRIHVRILNINKRRVSYEPAITLVTQQGEKAMDWKKGTIGFDRIGHWKVIENDGKNVTAKYFSGGRRSGEKSFKVGNPDVERVHVNIAQEYETAYQLQKAELKKSKARAK